MEIISFRFQDFLSAFIILFAVIDITGLTPIIIDMKQKGQNIIAWKAAVYSLVTFLAFLFMGNMILNLFQVDISSFAIAGALVIFVMAIEMLLGVEIFRNDGPEGAALDGTVGFPFLSPLYRRCLLQPPCIAASCCLCAESCFPLAADGFSARSCKPRFPPATCW